MCNLRMSHLSVTVAYTYGIASIFAAMFATFGNVVVLKILWMPNMKNKSNKILTSLAISDLSVGIILLPIFFGQLLSIEQLHNCAFDYIREYITTVTIGSSLLALGVVSYDRYILMTELPKYDRIMNKRKIITMITLSWLVPAIAPVLRFVGLGEGPFLYFVILLTFCPLVILMFTYYKIMRCINASSARVDAYSEDKPLSNEQKNNNKGNPKQDMKEKAKKKRAAKRNIKFAKAVSLLIVTYGVCLLPSCVWSISDLINASLNFTELWVIQNMYVFACFAGSMNSCANPLIYFLKQPDIRRAVIKMFNLKRVRDESTSVMESQVDNEQEVTGVKVAIVLKQI